MWRVEYDPLQSLLVVKLHEVVRHGEMRELSEKHAEALDATGGEPFGMLLDLRGLHPLDSHAAALLSDMKRVATRSAGYKGRAVLIDSATVGMQQHNTRLEAGDQTAELITSNTDDALAFVRGL